MRGDYGFWPRYERTQRIATKDGIKSRSRDFATAWWSKQWMASLDAFGWSNRLARGRSYARSGQVLDYTTEAGCVTARVQGSRRAPYVVTIKLEAWSDPVWEHVLDALGERAEFAARLLAGDMPPDIGDAFGPAGVSLLPTRQKELVTECSCPDWANPCKHIAAVHYILAEALDADPFLLLALRGRDRNAVMECLRRRRGHEPEVEPAPAAEEEPLVPEGFWTVRGDPTAIDVGLAPPRVRASVLRRLGAPGTWTTAEEMVRVFGPILETASNEALRDALEK